MEIKLTFEEEGFEGHVLMRVANNIERLELMEKLGINIMDMAKEDDGEKKATDSLSSMSTVIKLIKASIDFYEHVDLIKDGKEYHSFDDLNEDVACQAVQMSCATKALMGLGEAGKK
jgi:hypothetical protein